MKASQYQGSKHWRIVILGDRYLVWIDHRTGRKKLCKVRGEAEG